MRRFVEFYVRRGNPRQQESWVTDRPAGVDYITQHVMKNPSFYGTPHKNPFYSRNNLSLKDISCLKIGGTVVEQPYLATIELLDVIEF